MSAYVRQIHRYDLIPFEEEFWKIPPEKIFSIFEHKKDIAEQVIREKGFKLKKECHGGARKRTKTQILAKRAPGCTVPAVDSDFE